MLESLVTNLALSLNLKDAGCPQDSFFWWHRDEPNDDWRLVYNHDDAYRSFPSLDDQDRGSTIAAYLADELLLLIPESIVFESTEYVLVIIKLLGEYVVAHLHNDTPLTDPLEDPSLANACAQLYLALKKKGLV